MKFIAALLVAALAVLLSACSPLTMLNTFNFSANTTRTEGLAYGDDARQKLDIYTPPVGYSKPAPVVVFFYGGNWNSGQRGDYAFVGQALASHGIIAVIADYRLYPQVRYPQFIQDSAQAVAWTVREISRYGGDPNRLVLMGHSAGAYNAAMLALDKRWLAASKLSPSMLRGWIGLAGPYNFLPIENPEVRPIFFWPDTPPESQPVHHVTTSAPPALLIAPQEDRVVNPVRNTAALATQLRNKGVPVSEEYFAGVNHSTLIASFSSPLRGLAPILDTVAQFILSDRTKDAVRR